MHPFLVFRTTILAATLSAVSISAQVVAPPAPVIPQFQITGGVHLGAFKMLAVKGEPYSLISETTNSKKLTDGTWTTTVLEEHHMRDSEGRERSEIVNPDKRPLTPAARITDPVAQTIISLQPWDKTAHVTHIPLPKPPTPEQEAKAAEFRAKAAEYRALHPSPSESQLPPQKILGIDAQGQRRTITLGTKLPNGDAVTVVEDTWTAPDLNIPLAKTSDDPRGQKIIMTVTDLQRAEPNPTLFQIPADYKVTEQQN
jgi:hypothetical protein